MRLAPTRGELDDQRAKRRPRSTTAINTEVLAGADERIGYSALTRSEQDHGVLPKKSIHVTALHSAHQWGS